MCKPNLDPIASPGELSLPLARGQIEAARETLRDNKGAQWSVCFSIGIQVGSNIELRDNLVRLLVECGIPTSTISDMFGLSGRALWEIAQSEPISLFSCLGCGDPMSLRDRRDLMRLQCALDSVRKATPGGRTTADLFCGVCTEALLRRLNEQARRERRATEARIWELNNKMSYAEYLLAPEWRAVKSAALAWAGHRCQVCNQNGEELHVHHRVYTRRGCERPEDLTVLCRTHHDLFHGEMPDAS